jgi:RNA polymerase sigma-70 factor (ECF subfamily)
VVVSGFDVAGGYRRFGEAVHHRALRTLRDRALADDIVQETFLRAHKARGTWAGGSELSWLLTIADRLIIDLVRKRGAVMTDDDARAALAAIDAGAHTGAGLATRPMNQQERLLHDERVAHALSFADQDTAQILLHRYIDELSTDDISQRTGHSERTIRRRLQAFFARVAGSSAAPTEPPCAA